MVAQMLIMNGRGPEVPEYRRKEYQTVEYQNEE